MQWYCLPGRLSCGSPLSLLSNEFFRQAFSANATNAASKKARTTDSAGIPPFVNGGGKTPKPASF
ncbi:hypothetical protein B4135_4266 [Caldibacillus debilis]|uniref:Uncharacterized protein n=1 Tax=Caldibacillus debilis TaxID=301148 RepID=A0A150L5L2_9BACI|nr:hypothetical protein B4135_4266 [Caldibacillus debilis]